MQHSDDMRMVNNLQSMSTQEDIGTVGILHMVIQQYEATNWGPKRYHVETLLQQRLLPRISSFRHSMMLYGNKIAKLYMLMLQNTTAIDYVVIQLIQPAI